MSANFQEDELEGRIDMSSPLAMIDTMPPVLSTRKQGGWGVVSASAKLGMFGKRGSLRASSSHVAPPVSTTPSGGALLPAAPVMSSESTAEFLGASSRGESRTRHRRMSHVSSHSLEKESSILASSSHAVTLRKIFEDADVEGVGFLTPDTAFSALKVVGATMTRVEMGDFLDEIDVNEHSCSDPCNQPILARDRTMLDLSFSSQSLDSSRSSASTVNKKRKKSRRVLYEDFEKIIELWQTSARFQLFEHRSEETEKRLTSTMQRKFLTTDCTVMWIWQVIMLCVACYLVMVPIAVFTNTEQEMAKYFAMYTPSDAAMTFLLLADMIIKTCCCTTVVHGGVRTVVDDWWGIVGQYVRSPVFYVDLLVLVPWRFLVFVGGDWRKDMAFNNVTGQLLDTDALGCVGCETIDDYRFAVNVAIVLLLIRAVKIVEHFRYFEETGLTPLTRGYIFRQFVLGQAMILVARFAVVVHTCAVIFLSIDKWSNRQDVDADGNSRLSQGGSKRYAEALYLVLYCMATVGYGDVPPIDNTQRVYFMFLTILGWLFSAYVVGSLVGFMQTSDIETGRQSKLLELSTLLTYFEVPDALALEVLSFQNYVLAVSIQKSFSHVVSDLPVDMQHNLELWNRVKVIDRAPLFATFHKSAKLQICNALVEITFCPEDYVYMIGESGSEMFFINHGFVDLLDCYSTVRTTLRGGDHFGELGAFDTTDTLKRSEDSKCLTYCEFFVLSSEPLMEVRSRYPRVQREIEIHCNAHRAIETQMLDMAMSVRFGADSVNSARRQSTCDASNPPVFNPLSIEDHDIHMDRPLVTFSIPEQPDFLGGRGGLQSMHTPSDVQARSDNKADSLADQPSEALHTEITQHGLSNISAGLGVLHSSPKPPPLTPLPKHDKHRKPSKRDTPQHIPRSYPIGLDMLNVDMLFHQDSPATSYSLTPPTPSLVPHPHPEPIPIGTPPALAHIHPPARRRSIVFDFAEDGTSNLAGVHGGRDRASPVTEDDWTTVRGEVSRLSHGALVEIAMQCLESAYAVNQVLGDTARQ